MMIEELIEMPITCKFMAEAYDYLRSKLPIEGHYILSKGLTGCGGTTMFIRDNIDVIILSPRRKMIENKIAQEIEEGRTDLYYVNKENVEKTADIMKVIRDLKEYCGSRISNNQPIKLICCYDSLRTIVDAIGDSAKGIRIVVDEWQLILTDAGFKAETEAD